MKKAIIEERVLLEGHTLLLTFRSGLPLFACDLRTADGETARTSPALAIGETYSSVFDLTTVGTGVYSIAPRSADQAVQFGRLIAEQRAQMARGLRGTGVAGNTSKVASSAYTTQDGERFAAIYADLATSELHLRLATTDDIDAFLAPWAMATPGIAPIRFSVVCPVYNVEKYLNDMLISITGQTLDFRTHIELILVDDGSTDGSARIIKHWQKKHPDNIRYVFQENAGVAAARNLGLSLASHEWVTFPDPDDFVDWDYFAEVAEAIDRHRNEPIAMIACNMILYYEAAALKSDSLPLRFRFANGEKLLPANDLGRYIHGYCNAAFFRKDAIAAADLTFDSRVRPSFEDGHFVGRYLLSVPDKKALFLPQAKYFYRKRGDRSSVMDGARKQSGWYGDVLRHGHLDLLVAGRDATGSVPRQIQTSVLYAISSRLKDVVEDTGGVWFLTDEQRADFRALLGEIFSLIDVDAIMEYDVSDMPFWHRVGLLNLFKHVDPPAQEVEIVDYDVVNGLAHIVHWSRSATPTAEYLVNGTPIAATRTRSQKRMFMHALYVWQHAEYLSLPIDGSLTILVGGTPATIIVGDEALKSGPRLAYIRRAFTGRIAGGDEAAAIDAQAWRGFSRPARTDLAEMYANRAAFLGDRLGAAFGLARWQAALGNHAEALDWITRMHALTAGRVSSNQALMLELECLLQLGLADEARVMLEETMVARQEFDPDLYLAYANCFAHDPSADETRLEWINRVYDHGGIHRIQKRDPHTPLTIDNLIAPTAPRVTLPRGPKVSVILPVHNSADTIGMAIRSVLDQTWSNLELIVVDDHSTDDTWDVIQAIAEHAPIVAIRQEQNRGAYAARNRGLTAATGDLTTTHDADDWSHPQKIETQVRYMMEHTGTQGTRSAWSRVTRNLYVAVSVRPGDRLVGMNYSSFMFTGQMKDALGCWDEVRTSSDNEFIKRAYAISDPLGFSNVADGIPLAFGLKSDQSLTGSAGTHLRTRHYGVRRDYIDAAERWHRRTRRAGQLRLDPSQPRPFPAPARLQPRTPPAPVYDCVFVFDYTTSAPDMPHAAMLNGIAACIADGQRVGVFFWRDYAFPESQQDTRVLDLIDSGAIGLVSAGDTVTAGNLIVGQPSILRYPIDDPPAVTFENLVVLVSQPTRGLAGDQAEIYDPRQARQTLAEAFGDAGLWVPVSPLVHRMMRDDARFSAPHPEPWYPVFDLAEYTGAPIAWRGATRPRPVVGRHGRDDAANWPADRSAVLAAYCAGKPCTVHLLGCMTHAARAAGTTPPNWTADETGSIATADFLRDLDFFVHYPRADLIEPFPLNVGEAMAAGRPVILPPVFAEIFGDAAAYAEPDAVWATVSRLWADESAYLAQALAGREFALRHLGLSRFTERLAGLDAAADQVRQAASA